MQYYVYILKSLKNNNLYKGYTTNLDKRLHDHNVLKTVHTDKKDGPYELCWYAVYKDKYKALAFEKYLKSGSGRAFINRHLV